MNTEANGATSSLAEKILATLENMEASTMRCLQECVAKLAEVGKITQVQGVCVN